MFVNDKPNSIASHKMLQFVLIVYTVVLIISGNNGYLIYSLII